MDQSITNNNWASGLKFIIIILSELSQFIQKSILKEIILRWDLLIQYYLDLPSRR